ncbi:MAG: hypothetical protein GX899_03495 [Rikenellaceae bacterium]|jgi:hypothetical protein|nr:hypothetical protein [Rikenellaceae bacterium]
MTNRVLTEDGWQKRVRNILGVDEAYLPDADIEQPDIISVAEANVIALVPGYADLDADKRLWLESATVCECAALLCYSMPARVPVREQGPHFTRDVTQDWGIRREELEKERNILIGKITAAFVDVPHFGRTKG